MIKVGHGSNARGGKPFLHVGASAGQADGGIELHQRVQPSRPRGESNRWATQAAR